MGRTIKRVNMAAVRPAEKLKRVAAYARVSCGKDAMLHSLSAQVSYYSGLIQKTPGWEYAGVYADEAVSGTKNSRGEFQKMLAECRAGNIREWGTIKNRLRDDVGGFLFQKTRRSPMILPIIQEIRQ